MFLKVVTLCALFPAVFSTIGISVNNMLPYGPTVNDAKVSFHDQFANAALLDAATPVTVGSGLPSFKIFGVDLGRNMFINFNGHVTFGAAHDKFDTFSVNSTSSSVTAIFNVFFSDNDIRRPDGAFYHRLSSTVSDRSAADAIIRGRGFTTFSSSYCLIVTWEKVKYYVSDASRRNMSQFQQENTYQEILCTDGNEGHVIYHYQDMLWTKSEDPSTNPATIGWMVKQAPLNSIGRFWAPPASGSPRAHEAMALGSNVGLPGRWMRSQEIVGPCVGASNGMYKINCTHYRECCGQQVQSELACPSGTTFHPTLKFCVDSLVYTCDVTHFCAARSDGRYANSFTIRADDYWRCLGGTGRILLCPFGSVFGASTRCR